MPTRHILTKPQFLGDIRLREHRHAGCARAEPGKQHLSICTNKTCKKQGCLPIAKFVEDLGIDDLTVERTGCLGKCGSGPNMVLSPLNVTLNHVQTVSKMTDILREVGGFEVPEEQLKATTLRLQGNSAARDGDLEEAQRCYSEALELNAPYGRHMILSNKAGVLLGLGRHTEAAAVADEAVQVAPPTFFNAVARQVDAYIALGNRKAALEKLDAAVKRCPDFRHDARYSELRHEL